MNAMEMRKSLLRSRALEFTRLLLLSQLEEADSTFWAMAAVLKAELTASCGTTPDHFLQLLAESIDELREKFAQRPSGSSQSVAAGSSKKESIKTNPNGFLIKTETIEGKPLVFTSNGVLSSAGGSELNAEVRSGKKSPHQTEGTCKKCKTETLVNKRSGVCSACSPKRRKAKGKTAAGDQKSLLDVLVANSAAETGGPKAVADGAARKCAQCSKEVALSAKKAFFRGLCSSCYYKCRRKARLGLIEKPTKSPEDSPPSEEAAAADERKCAECLKTIPPNIAFYRSSQLCKNCYERRRVLIRKQTGGFQPLCSSCQQPAEGEMLDGKCIPCMYEEIQNKADEQPLDSAFNRSFIQFEPLDEKPVEEEGDEAHDFFLPEDPDAMDDAADGTKEEGGKSADCRRRPPCRRCKRRSWHKGLCFSCFQRAKERAGAKKKLAKRSKLSRS